jgi:hypothetical protein
LLDKDGNSVELKDDEDDDGFPVYTEDTFESSDEEIEAEGFTIEDVPEDEFGADFDESYNDYDTEEDM